MACVLIVKNIPNRKPLDVGSRETGKALVGSRMNSGICL